MPLKKDEAEKLIDVIRGFVDEAKPAADVNLAGGRRAGKSALQGRPLDDDGAIEFTRPAPSGAALPVDEEAMYQRFRARFIDDAQADPVLLKLIMVQPELIVGYERKVEQLDGSTLRGRVARLVARGFFDDAKTTGQTRTELTRTGTEPNSGGLSTTLAALVGLGFLVRAGGEGWQKAPGVKATEREIETKG